jgi:hypothetical protein
MNKIQEIIEEIDKKNLQDKYINTLDLIKYVESFIKRKQLIIYGGFAINLLMPKKDKFYKEYTMNDLDCFSPNAKQDAMELAKELSDNNYKYIKVRKALHENTYKVYADFVQIIDLTQLDNNTFNNLKNISEYEKKNTELYKYYEDSYVIAPVILLKANMHYELARPRSSYFRWEKIYKRITLLNKLFKFNKKINILPQPVNKDLLRKVLKYIKENNNVIIGENACKLYGFIDDYTPNITILSTNVKKTQKDILELLGTGVIVKNNILHGDNIVIKIVSTGDDCFSYYTKNNYMIGSLDTTLYFMYKEYLESIILGNINNINNIYKFIQFIEYNMDKDPIKRLKKECYGTNISMKDILIKKWKKRQTLEYF